MKLKRHPWKKNLLNRMVFSFICILLPLFILSMIIYSWGVRTLKDEISKSMISQVSQYFGGLEKEFQRIQMLQYDCLNDENLNALGAIPESMSNIERMQSILRLQQRLNAIRNSSAYIVDVYAYIPSVQKKVTALSVSAFDQQEFTNLRSKPVDSQVVMIDGKMYLTAAYPFSANGSKTPLFIIAVEFSKDKLVENLKMMTNTPDEGLIMTSPEFVLATSNQDTHDMENFTLSLKDMDERNAQTINMNGEKYLAVYEHSDFFGAVVSKYVPVSSVFQPLDKFRNWFILLAGVSLIIIIIYSLYAYKYIHKPLFNLVKAFLKVEHGDFSVQIAHDFNDEFQYIYTRFNIMLEKLKSLVDEVYKQQILMHKAELKQLQSQINPHFLYNSFFILNTMAHLGDNENLEKFTNQLGEYFQFITRNNSDEVPLSKEVNHAKVYSEIQAMRFANRNRVEFGDLPDNIGHVMVPRLILQPIIENAFEHGLEKKRADGILRVQFLRTGSEIRMIIEDNGEELKDEQISLLSRTLSSGDGVETTGLLNIHQRIRLKFGGNSGLYMERSEWGGLKATICIVVADGGI